MRFDISELFSGHSPPRSDLATAPPRLLPGFAPPYAVRRGVENNAEITHKQHIIEDNYMLFHVALFWGVLSQFVLLQGSYALRDTPKSVGPQPPGAEGRSARLRQLASSVGCGPANLTPPKRMIPLFFRPATAPPALLGSFAPPYAVRAETGMPENRCKVVYSRLTGFRFYRSFRPRCE